MEPAKEKPTSVCHVVAVPYPGRGHVNPMMNLCKQLASRKPDNILITFVVTDEWLGFIGSDPKPNNIRFRTLPNIIPSELVRAKDFPGFIEAVTTKLEAPFEQLLDQLEPPVSVIIADPYLSWDVGVANRRNIPIASLWTMSATVFSIFLHFDLLLQNRHFPASLSGFGNEVVDYIPGIPPTKTRDLPTFFFGTGQQVLDTALNCVSHAAKAQYLLFTSVHELEPHAIEALKSKFSFPVYPIGPSIPYLALQDKPQSEDARNLNTNYFQWLDSQPRSSVLYISLGSFLSVSKSQMEEIIYGVQNSNVRYLWVIRDDISQFDGVETLDDKGRGLITPWCDQLRVLCHPSIGGFWTHCGWNSTLEAIYAGVPMLTFPIFWDQVPNSKQIVEDWKIGWRAKRNTLEKDWILIEREEIANIVQRFLDFDNEEVMQMRRKVEELKIMCRGALTKRGFSYANLDSFVLDISKINQM